MIRGTPSLQNTKSLLAKLMAQENISVIHENLPTAYFDLQNRELHCPVWKDMSPELYDLLMGHEISHALHTPKEGWHSAINTCKKAEGPAHKHEEACFDLNFKDFLNVCEDARIEKMIKRVFPGLKASFSKAYQELWDRDFFGIKELRDLSHLMLIDRINVHFKMGALAAVKFSAEEQPYVDQLEKAETWAEVEAAARALYKWSNDNEQDKKQLIKTLDMLKKFLAGGQKGEPDPDAEPREGQAGEGDGESQSGQDGEPTDKQGNGQGRGQESKDGKPAGQGKGDAKGDAKGTGADKKDAQKGGSSAGDGGNEKSKGQKGANGQLGGRHEGEADKSGPRSITDRAFRKAEEQLSNNMDGWMANVTLPKPNLQHIIYSLEEVVNFYEGAMANDARGGYSGNNASYASISQNILNAFQSKNKNYINMLVKEFEMRKNATQYYRAKTSRSGEIDSKLLSRYKFSNDIFRRITDTPKGKNHGLVMFLDMSGSMDGSYMRCAVEQIIILAMFCNKVRVPYDVYGFADNNNYGTKYGQKFSSDRRDLQLNSSGFHLRTLISSSVPHNLQKRAMRMLAFFATQHVVANNGYTLTDFDTKIKQMAASAGRSYSNNGLSTHGTPLCETIVASRAIVDQFKMNHKSDIVNVIYLSDGDGAQPNISMTASMEVRKQRGNHMGGVTMVDPLTKHQMVYAPKNGQNNNYYTLMQDALVKMIGEVTGCRHLGFYISTRQGLKGHVESRGGLTGKQITEAKDQLSKRGYCAVPAQGFHHYYYVSTEMMGYEDHFTGSTTNNLPSKEGIESAFRDNQKNKANSRAMLGEFAKEIATQDGLND